MQKDILAKIKEHYRHPQNSGKLKGATHSGEVLNPICGDEIKIYLQTSNGRITDVGYEVQSCMLGVAGASMLSEYIKGKSVLEARKINKQDLEKLMGFTITVARESCATLFLKAMQNALESQSK